MFKVYCDDKLIYNDAHPIPETQLVDPKLILETNNAGSFEFTMPTTNSGYEYLTLMKSTITVFRDEKEIWSGRPLSEDQSFYNQRIVYCEGELAYLNDTNQPQREYTNVSLYQFIKNVLDIHNSKVPDNRKIYISSETISTGEISYRYTQFEKTLETINRVLEDYGGYVRIRKDIPGEEGKIYLEFIQKPNRTSTQTITFGKNLLDFTRSYDMSELATVVLPLGEITARANAEQIGDEIPYENEPGNNILEVTDKNDMVVKPISGTYYVTKPIDVEGLKTIYISARNHNGYGLYSIRDSANTLLTGKNATNSIGTTDLVENKIDLPIGSKWLRVGGYGNDLTIRVNKVEEVSENLDEYLTVEKVNDGSLYVIAESTNKFKPSLEQGFIDPATGNDSNLYSNSTVRTSGAKETSDAEYISLKKGKYVLSSATEDIKAMMFLYEEDVDPDSGLTTGVRYVGTYPGGLTEQWFTLPMKIDLDGKKLVRFAFSKIDGADILPTNVSLVQLEEGDEPTQYEPPISSFDIYGWVEKQVTWDDVSDPEQLLENAKQYLTVGQFDNLTLSVKALDMRVLGADIDAVWILDNILVKSIPHGLNRWFEVHKLEIPLANPDQMEFTLGAKPETNLTSVNNATNSEILNKIAAVPSKSSILEAAKENAGAAIRNAMLGYVTMDVADLSDHATGTRGMYFTDRPIGIDLETGITRPVDFSKEPDSQAKGLLINQNGIAFYNDFNDLPTVAIVTESGHIVANAITSGTMSADRILGGTLRLGSYTIETGEKQDGTMVVMDGDGNVVNYIGPYGNDKKYVYYQIDTVNSRWIEMKDGVMMGGKGTVPEEREGGAVFLGSIWADVASPGVSIESNSRLNFSCTEISVADGRGSNAEVFYGINKVYNSRTQTIHAIDGDFDITFCHGLVVGWRYTRKTPDIPTTGYTGDITVGQGTMHFENGLLKTLNNQT